MRIIRQNNLFFAWLVAVVATLGSLYFSEIRGFIPCELCWFQRILMYPLSIILGIAAFLDDDKVKKYVLPLSIIGIFVSTYHYMKQKLPWLDAMQPCTKGIPCNTQYINWFGFVTIPFLALTGFVLITLFLSLKRSK
ncbi:disulfide oxidoreductase [Paenibacillus sp. GCM10012307]|uniref:Disulfide bond formation protein B n=1 Tax=Paenibacillus roseus TaxID=2798579 RepID=A0A934J032_9BACL|nr:disulfide oxidoreductase [Paenibacillus roseus]MBJ6360240.1 disulfide bond formation protein B [Paenibacillus roseus]